MSTGSATGGKDPLRTYRSKRRFGTTTEPEGREESESGASGGERGGESRFVVQIHDATTLHFDFRLEVEGVLKSWSVPKGPSTDPHDKRLAMPTEDHPLAYRTFEGVIPEGEYGAGPVIVWDTGGYEPLKRDFPGALDRGHVSFALHGSKLHGAWALTRFRDGGDGEREAWLLVKENDGRAGRRHGTPDPLRARSALSGRTLRQVADAGGPAPP
ncbi:DNA polymerase ligase N-terminal domain-containing protein [Streptomyces boncukensis]|uniref:3'-phosphoesterase n=1 Tax=Streptomyces boncukensis TaxID=2711219 RepID=A0A6G4WRL1_9ACTN|nr:DNA polymerase ligase N-terminal domain-containing protein [Streptomyces boncukensis]NGO67653.1 3'-phosphoesterase [Streptomyces boncukensis]